MIHVCPLFICSNQCICMYFVPIYLVRTCTLLCTLRYVYYVRITIIIINMSTLKLLSK